MKQEHVDAINKEYGQYKDYIISLSEKKYKAFAERFMKSAKTVNDLIHASTVVAVMNGWRSE
jgi:hypothetical protein